MVFFDGVEELATAAVLGDDVVEVLIVEDLVQLYDVWVVEGLQELELAEERLLHAVGTALTDDFDSSLFAGGQAASFVDATEAALA